MGRDPKVVLLAFFLTVIGVVSFVNCDNRRPPAPLEVTTGVAPILFEEISALLEKEGASGSGILWVGAHPDDEVMLSPLFKHFCNDKAYNCKMLVLTRGENGNCGLVVGCSGDLGSIREKEMIRSAEFLKMSLVQKKFKDSPDSNFERVAAAWGVEAGSVEKLLEIIKSEITSQNPRIVFSMDPRHGSTCHPDHRAAGMITLKSLEDLGFDKSRVFLLESAIIEDASEGTGFQPADAGLATLTFDAQREWPAVEKLLEIHESQFDSTLRASFNKASTRRKRIFLTSWADVEKNPGAKDYCSQ